MSTDILLMTSAIDCYEHVPYLFLKDSKTRLHETLCSILSWIDLDSIKKIILCDNTNIQYDFSSLIQYANLKGVELEILPFQGNFKKVALFGKGYGEGEIINYAIDNSKYLDVNSVVFYKTTSRLFVSNFMHIQSKHAENKIVFNAVYEPRNKSKIKKALSILPITKMFFKKTTIDTRFYKCSIAFYKKHLRDTYKKVNDNKGFYLESAFFHDLQNVNFSQMIKYPFFIGRSGSSGNVYRQFYKKKIQELASKFLLQVQIIK